MNSILISIQRSNFTVLGIAVTLGTVLAGWALAQTPLSNTPVTEAQIAHLFTSNKPVLYACQTGIFDDLGNLDGDWDQPPSPGRITSAAWDIGGGRFLYAYQLSNPNFLDPDVPYYGAWDVAVSGFSKFRISMHHRPIIPVDFDGDQVLDTSFKTTDHACNPEVDEPNPRCSPFTGPFAVFTGGSDECARSWSDYYAEWGGSGVHNDAIQDADVDYAQPDMHAEFAVEYDPYCCAHGIFLSSQVFGFVTDAPPGYVDGVNLGGASASIRIVAPVPRVLLVHGICGQASSWDPFADVLSDSGFAVSRLPYGSPDYSLRPEAYVGAFTAVLDTMRGQVDVVTHSMGGLIAREYLRRRALSGKPSKIRHLVTLGTPHHGSDLVAWALAQEKALNLECAKRLPWMPRCRVFDLITHALGCLGSPVSRPALLDMVPGSPWLNRLNYGGAVSNFDTLGSFGWGAHQPEAMASGVYYATIGGTGSFCFPGARDRVWGKGASYHPNDCTVATGSAEFVNSAAFRARDSELPISDAISHAPAGGLTFCHPRYYSSQPLARKVVRILESSPTAPPVSAPLETSSAEDVAPEDSLVTVPAIVDSVGANQLATKSVSIPATTLLTVLLTSTDAHLTLQDPDGVTITAADTSSANVSYFASPEGGLESFELTAPKAGTWTIRIDATASGALQQYGCVVSYASSVIPRLVPLASVITPADSVRVRGWVADAGSLRTDLTWSCRVIGPDGLASDLDLFDDGVHADSLSGDGIYGGVLAPSAGVGTYEIAGSAVVPGLGEFVTGSDCEVANVVDLTVQASDITLSRNLPQAGDSLTISAKIHNTGSTPVLGVGVEIRDLQTDTLLVASTVDVPAMGPVTVQAPWITAEPDSHVMEVYVSPFIADEANFANNLASRLFVLGTPLGVGPGNPSGKGFKFYAPRPNPSLGVVVLAFQIPGVSSVRLAIFDVAGRLVRRWDWAALGPGEQRITWDGRNALGGSVAPGLYLCRLEVGGQRVGQKVIIRR